MRANRIGLQPVLIETYWNVKIYTFLVYVPEKEVLIETYWNVKSIAGHPSIAEHPY